MFFENKADAFEKEEHVPVFIFLNSLFMGSMDAPYCVINGIELNFKNSKFLSGGGVEENGLFFKPPWFLRLYFDETITLPIKATNEALDF